LSAIEIKELTTFSIKFLQFVDLGL